MMNLQRMALAAFATMILFGCGSESPKMLPKVVLPKEDYSEKPTDFTIFNPKVDILFVIDDSGSMYSAQTNLSRNAYQFADAISKMSVLDFHIGVVSSDMYDCRTRCGRLVGNPAFVDKSTTNMVSSLARNMEVGTNGHYEEEMFNPVLHALTPPLDTTANAGFYRQDAFLAVIFLTDADDQGRFSPQDFYQQLVARKGDANKVLGYGVIRTLATRNSCDGGGETIEGRLESFLEMVANGDKSQNNILSFCTDDYGVKLAEFARDIVSRTAGVVRLSRVPNVKTIQVTYGTQVIPNSVTEGWVYEPSTNSIILAEGIDWNYQGPNVGLKIDFEVIDLEP